MFRVTGLRDQRSGFEKSHSRNFTGFAYVFFAWINGNGFGSNGFHLSSHFNQSTLMDKSLIRNYKCLEF